jgi:hypothetical protein
MIARAVVTTCVALLAACATQQPAPPAAARSPAPSPSTEIAASGKQEAAVAVSSTPTESKPQAEPKPQPQGKTEAAPEPKPETKPEPRPEPKPKPKPKPTPTPSTAAAKPPAPLDLKSLEERLKDTDAIGLLTKLSLKNQVDDLVGEFRAYHKGERPPTLSQLRPSFDLLLMKVLSLLQDRDPRLAHDVGASREAIWGVLTDPRKLAEFS